MDIYIIDSNVIFSGVLNISSGIGQFILRTNEIGVVLYAPSYLKVEIEKHFQKILERSKLTEEEVRLALEMVYSRVSFIADGLIPFEEYVKAMRLVRDIDPDDVTFVALTQYMDETLWTGDTKLYKGLKDRGFKKVVNFNDLKKKYKV
ncbi:PIN domain-containing protein [Lewinella sp. LCG006]|uniref:PIN domain-containing protein n=1 Tax=Lewinella sp. LCG006 TaxID=3231911 RepID=UPI003460793B